MGGGTRRLCRTVPHTIADHEPPLLPRHPPTAIQLSHGQDQLTREDLIAICERAIVPQDHWRNRDSASAQLGVGAALVLLKAGCKFVVLTADN